MVAYGKWRGGLIGLALLGAVLAGPGVAAIAAEAGTETWSTEQLNAEGMKAVEAWLGSLVAGDPAGVAAVLAPEFQIVRSDGSAYGKDEYVNGGMAKIAVQPKIEKLVATGFGDHIVVRYMLTVEETIDGKPVEAHAPRLSVFRRSADGWLVVAHGNFAKVE